MKYYYDETNKRESKLGFVTAVVGGYALAAFVLNACGGGGSRPSVSTGVAANNSSAVSSLTAGALPFPAECAGVSTDVSAIPNETQSALLGTYFGTFTRMRGEFVSQPYTLFVSKAQHGNRSYLYGTLRSNGPAGTIDQALCLSQRFNGIPDFMGGFLYTFESPALVAIPALSENFDLAVELRLTLRQGNKVDPTQSAIVIKDCVFSEDCEALDVELAGFGKR